MSCLDNLIGIDNVCDPVTSVSGLKINDLPGMSLKIAESIITNEDISGKKLIEYKIQYAQKCLTDDLRNFLRDKFKFNTVLTSETVGFYKEDNSVTPLAIGRNRGIRIVVNEYNYTELQISRIGIKLTESITDDILVHDLTTGQLLDTIPFTSIADQVVYVDVNKKYRVNNQRQSIFISIDASVSDQYATQSGTKGCSGCSNNNTISWNQAGYISGQFVDSNFISGTGSGGLTIDYNVSCDIERFVCSLSQSIARPLLFKVGAEIIKELKFSKNLNSIVLIDYEQTKELLEYYEFEYTNGMNNLVKNLRLPDDICFTCNSKIKRTIQIP